MSQFAEVALELVCSHNIPPLDLDIRLSKEQKKRVWFAGYGLKCMQKNVRALVFLKKSDIEAHLVKRLISLPWRFKELSKTVGKQKRVQRLIGEQYV